VLSDPPHRLWARRSLFYLGDAPLLVTEVFLPGILQLTAHAPASPEELFEGARNS
jgi:chorismate-pyruvate lyase